MRPRPPARRRRPAAASRRPPAPQVPGPARRARSPRSRWRGRVPMRRPAIQPARLSSWAAGEEEETGDGAQDLRVVVVDAARPELGERQDRGRDEKEGEGCGDRAGAALRLAGDDEGQREEQERWPEDAGRQLRSVAAQQRREGADQGGERRVDQPRPVRDERHGCADARQRGVEPRRAGEQLAHRHQPQRVVRVAQPIGERRSWPRKCGDDEEGGGEQGPGRAARQPSGRARANAAGPVAKPASTSPLPRRIGRVSLRDAS